MDQLMELLTQIQKLSGAGLEFLMQASQGGDGGGAAPAGEAPPSEPGAAVPPGQ